MSTFELPKSISSLVEELQLVEMVWQGVPVQLPKFAVYSVVSQPAFDDIVFKNGRQYGVLKMGRYSIPIVDPFRGDIDSQPNLALILSHTRGNRFGLYGYPADHIEYDITIPFHHGSVARIVRDYV